jgi:hypothetical protein
LDIKGWWMRMRELGNEKRLLGAPAVSSKAAIEAACPTQVVTTSGRIYCIVSY